MGKYNDFTCHTHYFPPFEVASFSVNVDVVLSGVCASVYFVGGMGCG